MTSAQRQCVTSLVLAALSMLLLFFMAGGIGIRLGIKSIAFEGILLAVQYLSGVTALVTGILSLRKLSKDRSVPEQFTALAWTGTLFGCVLSAFVILGLVGFASAFVRGG